MSSAETYDARNYTIILRREKSGSDDTWVARAAELPGCVATEESPESAVVHALATIESYLQVQKSRNRASPPPGREPGGKFLLRIPKWVHRELRAQAEADGISLNQHVGAILAYWAGYAVTPREVVEKVVLASDHRPF